MILLVKLKSRITILKAVTRIVDRIVSLISGSLSFVVRIKFVIHIVVVCNVNYVLVLRISNYK